MSKNSRVSKKRLQNDNPKKKDINTRQQDIFQLIKKIPCEIQYSAVFDTYEENLLFTENALIYLEKLYPERLENIKLNTEDDDLYTLQYKLLQEILKDDRKIEINTNIDDIERKTMLTVLYPVAWKDFTWFMMEIKCMNCFPEPMKIGYMHFLKKYSEAFTNDDSGYNFLEDNFTGEFYNSSFSKWGDYIPSYVYGMEEDIQDEMECVDRFTSEKMPEYYHLQQEVKKYLEKDIKEFYNYEPENESLDKIKAFLIEGIEERRFSVWGNFADDDDYMEHAMVPYKGSIMLMYNSDVDVEKAVMHALDQDAHNGGTCPMAYHIVSNGTIDSTSEGDIIEFEKVQNLIVNLGEIIYQYYKEKFV